jgi:hypothetical protein
VVLAQPEAARGALAVGDGEVDVVLLLQLRQQLLDAVDPGLADDLAEEEDADGAQVDLPCGGRIAEAPLLTGRVIYWPSRRV